MFLILACVNDPSLERDMQSTEQSRPIPFLLFNEQKGVRNTVQMKSWHQPSWFSEDQEFVSAILSEWFSLVLASQCNFANIHRVILSIPHVTVHSLFSLVFWDRHKIVFHFEVEVLIFRSSECYHGLQWSLDVIKKGQNASSGWGLATTTAIPFSRRIMTLSFRTCILTDCSEHYKVLICHK